MDDWLKLITEAEKTSFVENGVKKVHYKMKDGREMAEEYNMETHMVVRRAWKVKKSLSSEPEWEIEVGDYTPVPKSIIESVGILEAVTEPCMSKRITKVCIEWRIRNLPYPINVYSVEVDNNERCITVRTSNKKFFKKIPVPDLERINCQLEQNKLTISHKHNTLIISYKKPTELTVCERLVWDEVSQLESRKDSAVQCPKK